MDRPGIEHGQASKALTQCTVELHIQSVSGGIVNILGDGSTPYSFSLTL